MPDGGGWSEKWEVSRREYKRSVELTKETHPDYGTWEHTYGKNGNRHSRIVNGVTEYYGVGEDNRLIWVNGAPTQPNPGQNEPYTLFYYNNNGQISRRDRRLTQGGPRQHLEFFWDGDGRLREVKEFGIGKVVFRAKYDGDGIRVQKEDQPDTSGNLQLHDYSYGPTGLLWESTGGGIEYTPGFGQSQGTPSTKRYYHLNWISSTRYLGDSSGDSFPQALQVDAHGNRSATQDGNELHSAAPDVPHGRSPSCRALASPCGQPLTVGGCPAPETHRRDA